MSDKTAEIYEKAKKGNMTAEEAWERLKELHVDWDIENILPEINDTDPSDTDTETHTED